ncbi:hypothetical protein QBZ16_002241 [Prototheca wickerhamii]|uniref:Uncharacterized protein n=1 Tax=Prototheca wickerhamii TaxID=3111 RepID=A0AAD9MNY1_PROWI|nr:hypothetical protein QBZ16_002241 [Prototheca wickerhamii]
MPFDSNRVQKEITDIRRDKESGVSVVVSDHDIREMVGANGAICLDILKDAWSPALTLKTVLLSIQALLTSPEPSDPQDAIVARQYIDHPEQFWAQAKLWTDNFALERKADEGKVSRLVEMGFDKAAAEQALLACSGDETAALERLLGGA